jgi:hypothetical protein
MARALRLFVLGVLAVGVQRLVAAGPSGAARSTRAQTGYGDDTVPPREFATNAATSAPKSSGGSSSAPWIIGGVIVLVVLAGGTYFIINRGGAGAGGGGGSASPAS